MVGGAAIILSLGARNTSCGLGKVPGPAGPGGVSSVLLAPDCVVTAC